jgi:hypothetical protein
MAVLHHDLDVQVAVTAPALATDQNAQAVVTVPASVTGQTDRVEEIVLASVTDQGAVTVPVMVIDQVDLAEGIDRIDPTGLVTFRIGPIDLTGLIAQAVRVGPTVPGGATAVSTIDLVGPTVQEVGISTIAGRGRDVLVTA